MPINYKSYGALEILFNYSLLFKLCERSWTFAEKYKLQNSRISDRVDPPSRKIARERSRSCSAKSCGILDVGSVGGIRSSTVGVVKSDILLAFVKVYFICLSKSLFLCCSAIPIEHLVIHK